MKKCIIICCIVLSSICLFSLIKYDNSDNNVSVKKITFSELYSSSLEGIVIDVRTNLEYETGHILDSINIPVQDIDEVVDFVKDKKENIFIYCKSGVRSLEAAEILISLGYVNVFDLGGINDYDGQLVK